MRHEKEVEIAGLDRSEMLNDPHGSVTADKDS